MREHKFRAWDKKHKMMWSGKHLFMPIDWESFSILGSLLEGEKFDISYSYVQSQEDVFLKKLPEVGDWENAQEDLQLLEYIGLKDRNKKKIFENDLLLYQPSYTNTPEILKVEYSKDKFAGFILQAVGKFHKRYKGESGFRGIVGSQGYPSNKLEIIGNIFENAELLR